MSYRVELVWNREFHWVEYGPHYTMLYDAVRAAKRLMESGDGARVKKARVLDDNDRVCWHSGVVRQ